MKSRKRQLYLVEILGLLLGLLWLSPFYLMIVNAFKTKKEIFSGVLGIPEAWTFDNFVQAFIDLDFLRSLFNSVLITVVSVGIIIIFASMAGFALARNTSKLSGAILLIFVAAMLIPFQSVMIPLVSLFGKVDLLNRAGLIFMYLGFGSSLSIFLYHGAMTGISQSLDEAAFMDGANKFQVFRHIIFPLLKPISVTVGILNVIWIWNDYLLPSLMLGQKGKVKTLPVAVQAFVGSYVKQWDLILSAALLAIIPMIIIFLIAQKQIMHGMVEGAIK